MLHYFYPELQEKWVIFGGWTIIVLTEMLLTEPYFAMKNDNYTRTHLTRRAKINFRAEWRVLKGIDNISWSMICKHSSIGFLFFTLWRRYFLLNVAIVKCSFSSINEIDGALRNQYSHRYELCGSLGFDVQFVFLWWTVKTTAVQLSLVSDWKALINDTQHDRG